MVSNSSIMDEQKIHVDRDATDLNSEAAMDKYLQSIGLYRKPVAKDGSCLFRAVAEKVYNTQAKHMDVRHECISYMKANRECFKEFVAGSFEHHLFDLQNPKEWAGQVEITALSMLYQHDIIVYQEINQPPQNVTDNGFEEKILLCFSNGNHYDCIYPKSFKEDAAIVQSLLYDHLYKTVLPECQKREMVTKIGANYADTGASTDGNGYVEEKSRTAEGKAEGTSTTDSSSISWQLQRSLDPNVYRNVALEVWEQSKQEQTQSDRAIAEKLQFRIGEECLLQMPDAKSQDDAVKARIDAFTEEHGLYTVWVPVYQEHYSVPSKCLRPMLDKTEKAAQISYTELPGYYKKPEDFQYPKSKRQKGKNNPSNRDEEQRWKRPDVRYDSKPEMRNDGKSESRGDQQGHRRDNRRDRRGGASNEKIRGEKGERYNDKKGRPNEKSGKKDAQRVQSPPAPPQKTDNRILPEEKHAKTVNEQENVGPVAVPSNPDYPSLKTQEKEKTAKQDESPAAFWQRMRKDVKPVVSENDKGKIKPNEVKTAFGTHTSFKEESVKLNDGTQSMINVSTSQTGANDAAVSAITDIKENSERLAKDSKEKLIKTEKAGTVNQIQSQTFSNKVKVKSPEVSVVESKAVEDSNLKLHESDRYNSGLESKSITSELNSHIANSNKVKLSKSDLSSENMDTQAGLDYPSFGNVNRDIMQANEKMTPEGNKHLENQFTGNSLSKSSTSHVHQTERAPPEAACSTSAASAASDAKEIPGIANSAENMVSFPTGFDEPTKPSSGHYPSDLDSSTSPLTFMSSHSDIAMNANEGNSDSAIALEVDDKKVLTSENTVAEPDNLSELNQAGNDQKSEQKIRILRKDNKDQFVYFTTSNENSLTTESLSSHSRDRSPEPDTKSTQVKKVSFGNVTEISQATSAEPFVPQPSASDYAQNPYGNSNGINEQQDQLYYDESSNFGASVGMPAQMMPMMMHSFPQPTEQIHIPQGYSVDPEGKDLPTHMATVQYFFNLGLQFQYLYMQPQPHAFYNMPVHQMPAAPLHAQPQPVQNQAASQLPQQRFSQPLDPMAQQFTQEPQEEFIAASSPATYQYDLVHHQSLNHVRQPHPNQNNASQYEQPPRMRRGRGRSSNLGPPMSVSRGYNIYNQSQQKQSQFRFNKRGFHMNASHLGPQNQSYMYH